ncbi:type II toxin-antitoxin system VapC family toxin [Microbacterium profundi]|uniref:type II toxin-antitoxin system VapC family toxin n=1 Tax=Microbacterium profundi TaxID=450380 RepID=UPI001F230329|nr:type II toxin-antitoxin system VapC family toxin [Microbacterium profundi]MCE7481880.1 type II toxin-antitoxin system VapC family toxin [Microbacterium profundi]
MRLLLDTHLLLWAGLQPDRLSPAMSELLEDESNLPMFSAASVWEISIKAGLGRADFTVDSRSFRRALIDNGYEELSITSAHAAAIADLPAIHRDPFDRMLVAQARVEGITLFTSDRTVSAYGSPARLV